MAKIVAVAFACVVLVLTAAMVPWRGAVPATGAHPPSLSVNDIFVNVDVKSVSGGEFEDASLVLPGAPDHLQTWPLGVPNSRK